MKIIIIMIDRSEKIDILNLFHLYPSLLHPSLSKQVLLHSIIIINEAIQQDSHRYILRNSDPFCHRQFLKGAAGHIDYDR